MIFYTAMNFFKHLFSDILLRAQVHLINKNDRLLCITLSNLFHDLLGFFFSIPIIKSLTENILA